jgi:hypothetical protein
MPKALIPSVTNGDGYPSRLQVIDTDTNYNGPNVPILLTYNATSEEWVGAVGLKVITLTTSGGNYILEEDGATVSTGPADSGSPVGSYSGGVADFTVQGGPIGADPLQEEVTLSPGSPGTLIPEV